MCVDPINAVAAVLSAIAALLSFFVALAFLFFERAQKRREIVYTILRELPAGLPHPSELKKSFASWYPRNTNANVTFNELYRPLIEIVGSAKARELAVQLDTMIVRDFFDLWSAQDIQTTPPNSTSDPAP